MILVEFFGGILCVIGIALMVLAGGCTLTAVDGKPGDFLLGLLGAAIPFLIGLACFNTGLNMMREKTTRASLQKAIFGWVFVAVGICGMLGPLFNFVTGEANLLPGGFHGSVIVYLLMCAGCVFTGRRMILGYRRDKQADKGYVYTADDNEQ